MPDPTAHMTRREADDAYVSRTAAEVIARCPDIAGTVEPGYALFALVRTTLEVLGQVEPLTPVTA